MFLKILFLVGKLFFNYRKRIENIISMFQVTLDYGKFSYLIISLFIISFYIILRQTNGEITLPLTQFC